MDKNIPLSELIRRGSKISGKCTQRLSTVVDRKIQTCAIGAAYLAKFGECPDDIATPDALHDCGVNPRMMMLFPHMSSEGRFELSMVISTLNDVYGWSREQIADWLEQQGI